MQSRDSLVIDDFEEFEFVEDFALLVLRALTRESADFAHEFAIRVSIRHFPNDARRSSADGGREKEIRSSVKTQISLFAMYSNDQSH